MAIRTEELQPVPAIPGVQANHFEVTAYSFHNQLGQQPHIDATCQASINVPTVPGTPGTPAVESDPEHDPSDEGKPECANGECKHQLARDEVPEVPEVAEYLIPVGGFSAIVKPEELGSVSLVDGPAVKLAIEALLAERGDIPRS
jgi:hypothetical protein